MRAVQPSVGLLDRAVSALGRDRATTRLDSERRYREALRNKKDREKPAMTKPIRLLTRATPALLRRPANTGSPC